MVNIKKYKIPKEIAVIYGGVSEEKEICTMEGELVIKLLLEKGHKVYPIRIDKSTNFVKLLEKSPKYAILCLSEDLGIQWILDIYGIKYNGSGPLATMLSLDKILVKKILEHSCILTPKFQILTKSNESENLNIKFPLVVKPSRGGCSCGLSLVKERRSFGKALKKAFRYDTRILIEEFIDGIEITIVCLGKRILGIVEIDKASKPIYDYQTKLKGYISYKEPARISLSSIGYIHSVVPQLIDIFNLRNLFRVDAIVKGNKVFILEINTLPFLAEGGEPYEAVKNKGLNLYDLLEEIVYDFSKHKNTSS